MKQSTYSKPFLFDSEYKAHKKDNIKETLQAHSDLTLECAYNLIETYNLEPIIENLSINYDKDIIKDLFLSVIYLHDFGKINPFFQKYKMDNDVSIYNEIKNKVDNKDFFEECNTQHSLLSVMYFVDYFYIKYGDEYNNLILNFAYLILKHHSSHLPDYTDTWNEKSLLHFLNYYDFKILNKENINAIFNNDTLEDENLYYLLRLNFGILTKSDYIATNQFMTGYIHKENIIKSNNNYIDNFWNKDFKDGSLNYNKNFQDKVKNAYLNYNDLNNRSYENINYLRTLMLNETIINYQQIDNNIFFLESPTGGGKTNISLALLSLMFKEDIKKVNYIFPFNKLSTQTEQTIINSFHLDKKDISVLRNDTFKELDNNDIDGELDNYELDKMNMMNNTFMNYPFLLMSHVRFFDIIKGNRKASMYHIHQLANSVVILDEIQSYNPKIWSKITYFIDKYSKSFNIKFIIMSATLPKIDNLIKDDRKFTNLISNRNEYFLNPNFKDRVKISDELLYSDISDEYIKNFSILKSESYYKKHNHCYSIIEFLYKNDASNFAITYREQYERLGYKVYVLSSNILSPKSDKIIKEIKSNKLDKIILICTQCIEAGVDIDMDLGFKDVSIIDSEEQLCGRINRNSKKFDNVLYLFNKNKKFIYREDPRHKVIKYNGEYIDILNSKKFDRVYSKVIDNINNKDNSHSIESIKPLLNDIKLLNYSKVDDNFKIIDDNINNISIFIPLNIPLSDIEIDIPKMYINGDYISGEKVYNDFVYLINNRKYGDVKKVKKYLSMFMTNLFISKKNKDIFNYFDESKAVNEINYLIIEENNPIYCYENGFGLERFNDDNCFI